LYDRFHDLGLHVSGPFQSIRFLAKKKGRILTQLRLLTTHSQTIETMILIDGVFQGLQTLALSKNDRKPFLVHHIERIQIKNTETDDFFGEAANIRQSNEVTADLAIYTPDGLKSIDLKGFVAKSFEGPSCR
ncbi:MAG: hypothetical protein GY801_18325, partial [bacterium]|nr:hypothetical protein [bacterium]